MTDQPAGNSNPRNECGEWGKHWLLSYGRRDGLEGFLEEEMPATELEGMSLLG